MFRTVPLSIIRNFSLYTQQYIQVMLTACEQEQDGKLASRIRRFRPDPARKLSANPYVLLCVQWKTPDDGQRDCPKRVDLYSKNKFEKLEHLVGFIIRIYHDTRSPERQIRLTSFKRTHSVLKYRYYCAAISVIATATIMWITEISASLDIKYPFHLERQFTICKQHLFRPRNLDLTVPSSSSSSSQARDLQWRVPQIFHVTISYYCCGILNEWIC